MAVTEATKFELRINLETAKQIVYTIPVEVLVQANKVIKLAGGGRREL